MLVFDACKIIREKMGLTDTQRESLPYPINARY